MSDVDIEVFSIKDPRPLTAKLRPASDTDFEDMFNIDEQEMDQLNFDTENVFEMTLSRNISMGNSFADVERSTSSEDKSAGEKRGSNKVSSSNTQTPYQKRKVRKKDAKQKRKAFKRVGANSSTSSISYQAHVKYDDNDTKTTNGQTSKGANKGSKDRTAKRKNSQLRGKHHSDQKQTLSSSNQTQNKSHQKYNETSLSSGAQSPTKRSEVTGRSKEKRKPNYEHIAKLAEINMGCSNPEHGVSWSNPPLSEGVTQDEEPMDESCELMEVCDSQEEETGMYRDNVIIDDKSVTHHQNDNCPENHDNTGVTLEESSTERDHTKIDLSDSRPRVRLTNLSLSMPNTRDGKRSDDEDAHSTWLLDCRNIWSSNKLKGHYQKIYQSSEFRERGYQNIRSQVEFNNKPVKANNRFMQSMKNSGPSRGCIMRTVKQGSFVLLGTVKTIKDDRDRLSFNF